MGKLDYRNLAGDEVGRKALLCAALALVLFGGIIITHWDDYELWQYPEHTYEETSWWHDYDAEVHQEWQARCESVRRQGVPTDC